MPAAGAVLINLMGTHAIERSTKEMAKEKDEREMEGDGAGLYLERRRQITLRFSLGPEYVVSLERLRTESPVLYSWAVRERDDKLTVMTVDETVGEVIAAYLRFRLDARGREPMLWARVEAAADYLCMDGLARQVCLVQTDSCRAAMCANCGLPFLQEENHSTACHVRPSIKRGSDWICTQCGLKTTVCNQHGVCQPVAAYHYSLS